MRHRFVTSAIYELPVGKGRRFMNRGGILNTLFGGYEIAWIQTVETGNPIGFSFANSPNNYYPTSIGNWVPNLVGTPTMPAFGLGKLIGGNRFDQVQENPLVDINNFAAPPAFTPGNAGRNIMTGPASYYSQVSAKKNFKFGSAGTCRSAGTSRIHSTITASPRRPIRSTSRTRKLFGKITSDVATANLNGEPLMNLMLRLSW